MELAINSNTYKLTNIPIQAYFSHIKNTSNLTTANKQIHMISIFENWAQEKRTMNIKNLQKLEKKTSTSLLYIIENT